LPFAALLAGASPAFAEDADDADDAEIVVTGAREQGYRATVAPLVNKSDTPLQQVPFSVQVVTRDLLADRGVTTLGEGLRYTPGLAPQVGFSASNDVFTIRGFRTNFTYKNGFRRSSYSVDNQLANIEQIEILKGAASALYGRAEPSGVVNIVTKKPTDDRLVDLTASYGDFDAFRATLDANLPAGDALGFRLNASYDDRGGYRDLAFSETLFVSPVARWQPGDRTTVTVEGEYSELNSFPDRGFGNNALFLRAPRDRQFAGADARLDRDAGLIMAAVDHRFSDAVTGRIATLYSESTITSLLYNYGFPPVLGAAGPSPQVNLVPNDTFDRQRNTTVQGELYARLATGSIAHKLLIGVERGSDRWDYTFLRAPTVRVDFANSVVPVPAQGPFTLNFGGQEDGDATAIYVQDELAFGPLRLTLGGRYDWNEARIDTVGFGAPTQNAKKEERFSPRIGLTYTPVPELSFYTSYAESFSPQPVRLRTGVAGALRGEALELGAKASLFGGRVNPTVALFEIMRRNAAVSDPADPPFSILVGESRSRGIEVEVPAAITPRWRLVANYTHLDAEVRRDTFLAPGTPLLNAPDHSASLWTSYDFAGALDGLTVGGGVLRIGERAANSSGTIFIPAYTRFDANLGYGFETMAGPVRAQLNVLNVTDKFYYDSGGSFLPLFPGAPRTVTASIAVRF
jgi:iron complex outermembrane recepter protein